MNFKTLDDFNVESKTVIVRVDFNTEVDDIAPYLSRGLRKVDHGEYTLKELVKKGAKIVVLSHQNFGGEDFNEHVEYLQQTLKVPVKYVDDLFGEKAQDAIKQLRNGEIVVLKDVYSWSEEKKVGSSEQQSKTALVQNLAPLADFFVNDAFSVARCNYVSVVGFTAVLPSVAGRVMERELKLLNALETSQHSCVYVLGGAKVEANLEISKYILNNNVADRLLLGGVFSQLFMVAKGISLGNKSMDFLAKADLLNFVPVLQELLANHSDKIVLPVDVALNVEDKRVEVSVDQLPSEYLISDIGSKTVENYVNILSKAKSIVVQGFLGNYDSADFCYGTKTVFEAIANSEAFKLACGGDTSAPFDSFGLSNKIQSISSAGGALTEALKGKKLPGIIALDTATEIKVKKGQTSFEQEVAERIKTFSTDQMVYFANLCAIRSLPFLGASKNNFTFWRGPEKQKCLYALFDAIDVNLKYPFYARDATDSKTLFYYNGVHATPDDVHAAQAVVQTVRAAQAVVQTVRTAQTAINDDIQYSNKPSFTNSQINDIRRNVTIAAVNAVQAAAVINKRKSLEDILLNDLELIKISRLDSLNSNISVYGEVWNKFQDDLTNIGCGYWAKLYTDLFTNRFIVDKKELNQRLSVPIEIKEKGAAAVAKFLEKLKTLDKKRHHDAVIQNSFNPKSTKAILPKLKSFYEFESMCQDVLSATYNLPFGSHFAKYGRQGQKQGGIDLYAKQFDGLIVVQCKNRLKSDAKRLISEISKDVELILKERKDVIKIIIMTSHDRDMQVQDSIMNLNEKYKSGIKVMFWEDIAQIIIDNDDLLEKYYRAFITSAEQGHVDAKQHVKNSEQNIVSRQQLEVAILRLIQKLFGNIPDAELVELRRQLSGTQGGFDIRFKYKDAMGAERTCALECKNVKRVDLKDIISKLEQLRISGETIHHWILISPKGTLSNELYKALTVWEEENRWLPIQNVQLWTQDQNVDELFALIPDLYYQYYPDGTLNPEEWDEAKRSAVQNKWKEKLSPAIFLPNAWKDYLKNSSRQLTFSESNSVTIQNYDELYSRRVPIPCSDEFGNMLNSSAEEYLLGWVNKSDDSVLFLLGEFGDGKTFLTYSLARRLTEDFLKSPDKGIIPIRLTLKDLSKDADVVDFLRRRLDEFGATLAEFYSIKQKHQVLIILDAFDEMSISMDLKSIEKNTRRLLDCVNLFNGLKIIITSRTSVFETIKPRLLGRIQKSSIIHLEPVNNQAILTYLKSYATEHIFNVFDKLHTTYDLLHFASKPLFLNMFKEIMPNLDIDTADVLSIYAAYVESALRRKVELLEPESGIVDTNLVLYQLELILEDFALMSFESGVPNNISPEKFKLFADNPTLATRLWNITSSTQEDREDVENRIINRSLLIKTDQGYEFCRKSFQEYFAARGLVRLLIEADKEPKTFEKAVALLSGANLTFDTITFVGLLLSKMATKDVDNAKRCLVAMIIKTRNQSREDVNIARLGASAINIYFATWQELPNIDDWTYLVLDNAYLPVADFSDKNLTGTSLRNAQLDNANFTNTNLTDCDLTGAKLIRECIVSASEDGTVRVWDSATGKLVRILEGHGSSVRSVCFSPDGKTIASASRDKTVRVWDSATGKLIHTIEGHTDSVTGVCFNPVDGNTIASVSSDKTLRVWDSKSGMLLRTLTGHTAPVSGVCFSPDGKTLASASRDMTVKLWDNETGEVLRTLTDHTDYVWCVCFSLDGKTLASASVDMTVRLWDCESGMLLRTLTGHTNSVYGMCFSPDGKYLASASRDRSVIIWEIENGKQIHILHGHKSSVFGICFSPNTRTLDCSKIDKPLILWFDVVRVTDVPVVGGKNAHLGEMLYTGLPVPKGFAVTSFAYERFIEETQLSTEIESIIKKTVTDHTDLKQRDAASNYIRKLIERTPMPKDIEETIRNAYEELNKRLNSTDDVFAAVISSATTEDLPDTSSVIHQETALNVKGSDDLIEKILKSWSSLFTPSAISYRGEKHLAHDEVSISVGVQQMINSRTGGIMYTLNPKTGDQNEIVIKGSFGLGEAVVSGSVNPDGFVVDKLAGDIKERCIAKKTVEYIRDLAGKTIHSNVVGDRVNEPCINDDEIMVLVDLARKIEKHYGKPMGIEWAIDKDLSFPENIFIVQTRPNILKSKQYDDLIIPFCKAIDDLNFEDAFVLLPKLESADPDRYKKLIDELAFVFNPTESLQSNKEKWIGKEPIEYKAKLWSLLTNENHRTQEDNADEMVQNTLSNDLKEAINQKDIEQITISEMEKTENPQQQKQQKGAALEVNVLKLIQKLFDNISDADGILVELRRQLSGSQGGFDIQFTYKDAMGAECTCNIECKDYVNTIITMETVSEKLLQKHTKMAESEKLHHWILISPTGKVANELYTALQKWEKNHFWRPIQKVQVWTGVKNETGEPREPCVNELFALIPEVYRHYYPGGTLNPEEWDEAKRSAVQNKWKEKLAPAILLSEAWSVYLRDPSKLLTDSENSPEIDGNPDALYKQYDALYKQHLPVRCCDEGGNLLNLSTEKYLLDWINKSANSALFLLGEFGDGKTFLTYSLARRLTEDFLKSPDKGIIPIRLTLKDLNNDNGNNFLCDRLNQFGATLNEFNTIKQKHTVLIILDGFDEMSIGMDLRTINENTRRLCKCVNLFNGLKIIITSRTPVFKKIWQQLLQRVQSSMTIYLAPIDNPEVKIAYLQEFAKEKHVQERFEKLCATHDLLGLASKPLFLEMVKTTMLNGEIKDVDNVTIYESYVEATLKRKEYTPIDLGSGLLVDLDRVLSQYKLVMEDFALMIFEKGIQTRISEKDFKHYTNEPELTTRIWKELTNPTTEDVENTENRIINRSLLKATDQGFTFCHRSMIEYFVANGICRRLIEAPNDAETFLFNTKLTFETIDFAGKILSKMSGKDSENAKQQLVSMITKTRWCSPDGDIARSGTSAINIYFAAWKELPNIDNWTYLFLDNASLPEADFSSKNLTGTSLKYANLDNVNFTNTNLTDCDLTGVKFDETNEIQTMKALQYNGYLYVLYIGGKLRKWNIHDGSHKDVSTNFDAPSNIGISIWDLMFFEKNKIHFTHKTTEEGALELRGGVQLHKDEVVLDIVENNVLVTRSNQLSFHNLATDAFVFENQPVSSLFKSVIVNDSSVLLFDNVNGLRLLIKDGNNEVHEKKLRVHDSNDRSFEDVITMAVQLIRTDVGVFRVCLGYKNHSLALYEFKLSEQQINEDTYYLKAIALHSCGQYIKNICFLSACKIVYTGIDGIIHVLTLNEFGELQEEPPWRLAIQCEGALVKGVKQEEQKVKLKEYGGIEQ